MIAGKTKVMFSPAALIHVFGPPSFNEEIEGCSTVFNFEDSNLDCFKIFDHYQVKETIDLKSLKLRHPPYSHRGKDQNLPTIQEFWKMQEKAEFWIEHTEYADVQKFVEWTQGVVDKGESAKERVEKKYGEIQYDDRFGKDYQISRDYAVFRYNKFKWD